MPLASVLHKGSYSKGNREGGITAYDQDISEYMLQRSGGKSDVSWSKQMSNRRKTPARMRRKSFLEQQFLGKCLAYVQLTLSTELLFILRIIARRDTVRNA